MRASYDGWCAECGQAIKAGEEIVSWPSSSGTRERHWVHRDCPSKSVERILASIPHCRICADVLGPGGTCPSCGDDGSPRDRGVRPGGVHGGDT